VDDACKLLFVDPPGAPVQVLVADLPVLKLSEQLVLVDVQVP
jgi:hypothetical protein